jgi:transposase
MPETLDPARERLAELVGHRRRLVEERVAVGNQTATLRSPLLQAQNRERLALIERQITQTNALIRQAVGETPSLLARRALMMTLKGVKEITAITLLALLPELGRITRRAIAALAGLAPWTRQSGRWKGKSLIGGGRASVRAALFVAALAAGRFNPALKTFRQRLIDAGKPKLVAVIAVARKLLTILNAIIRDQTPWQSA